MSWHVESEGDLDFLNERHGEWFYRFGKGLQIEAIQNFKQTDTLGERHQTERLFLAVSVHSWVILRLFFFFFCLIVIWCP